MIKKFSEKNLIEIKSVSDKTLEENRQLKKEIDSLRHDLEYMYTQIKLMNNSLENKVTELDRFIQIAAVTIMAVLSVSMLFVVIGFLKIALK